jgi:hypothetical protein
MTEAELKAEIESLREQLLFEKKCCMVYEAYLDKHFTGYLDGYQDLITEWLLSWWKEPLQGGQADWPRANIVVVKGLEPTLRKIKPMSDSLGVCPKCGHHFKI